MSFLVGPDSFRGSSGFYKEGTLKRRRHEAEKEQRHLTDSLFYLIYVTSDGFTLLPVFRNGLQEILQLRRCVAHPLRGRVDGTPETDERVR